MKTWPTVYKMTNTGKIQEWSISAEEKDGVGIYTVVHGQQNGKKQTTSTKILKGKNIGRANETTVWEQTQAEAEAQWTKKQERNGYTTTIPTSKPVRPMLAKQYEDEKHKLDWSKVVVQPKLDGCLSGDSLIKTKEHGFKPIKWIVENQIKCKVACKNNSKLEYHDITGHFLNKEESANTQWYELELETGEKLKLTGNHLVFLPNLGVWRRADELKLDDEVNIL